MHSSSNSYEIQRKHISYIDTLSWPEGYIAYGAVEIEFSTALHAYKPALLENQGGNRV